MMEETLNGEPVPPVEIPFHFRRSEKSGWVNLLATPYRNSRGGIVGLIITVRDVTERKRAEDEIRALLVEKEIILREVHHRIKNNLNMINGLLLLHARSVDDSIANAILKDAASRVKSMMVLYDKLYQTKNYSGKIASCDYLPSLVEEIVGNFPNSSAVTTQTLIDNLVMTTKMVQALGIIINELLTNIMKHSFPLGVQGVILVSLKVREKEARLEIEDNGVPMPEMDNVVRPAGFGLTLVAMMAAQLGGKLRFEREKGTTRILDFPIANPASVPERG
jgi:two-component sensor histidine kinase